MSVVRTPFADLPTAPVTELADAGALSRCPHWLHLAPDPRRAEVAS